MLFIDNELRGTGQIWNCNWLSLVGQATYTHGMEEVLKQPNVSWVGKQDTPTDCVDGNDRLV